MRRMFEPYRTYLLYFLFLYVTAFFFVVCMMDLVHEICSAVV